MANDPQSTLTPPTPPALTDIQSTSTAGGVATLPLVNDVAAAPAPVPQEIVGLTPQAESPGETLPPPASPNVPVGGDLKPIIPVPVFAEVTAPAQVAETPVISLTDTPPVVPEVPVEPTPEPLPEPSTTPPPEVEQPLAEEPSSPPAPGALQSLTSLLGGAGNVSTPAAPVETPPVPGEDQSSITQMDNTEETAVPASPATPPTGEEKSPLDILEEILAGAEAEKKKKEDLEAEKKAQEEQEVAEREAKETAFRAEAEQRLQVEAGKIEEAKQQRQQVEQDLIDQGKVDPNEALSNDALAIRQLQHETTNT